jgi:putative ABC transport system ATP-binding protein
LTIAMVTHEADVAQYGSRIVKFVDGNIASDDIVMKKVA